MSILDALSSTQAPDSSQVLAGSPSAGSQAASAIAQAPPDNQPTLAPQSGGLWKNVLLGALTGLAGSGRARNFGEGLAGGATAELGRQQTQVENKQRQQQADTAQTESNARLALIQQQTARIAAEYPTTPIELQNSIDLADKRAGAILKEQGMSPVQTFDSRDQAMQYASANHLIDDESPYSIQVHATPDGKYDVFRIADPNKPITKETTMTVGYMPSKDSQGNLDWSNPTPITQVMHPGSISIGALQSSQTSALSKFLDARLKAGVAQSGAENKIQVSDATGATAKNNAAANKANAAPGAKLDNLLVGSLPTGEQIAGTLDQLKQAGAQGITKLPSDESKKVIVARQMIAPNGLFNSVSADLKNLEAKGKLGSLASRWGEFAAGKLGDDPDFQPLRTDMGLLATALMQAHVGARGSHEMLAHFQSLADYRISDAATLKAALGREWSYVHEKAMLPGGSK